MILCAKMSFRPFLFKRLKRLRSVVFRVHGAGGPRGRARVVPAFYTRIVI